MAEKSPVLTQENVEKLADIAATGAAFLLAKRFFIDPNLTDEAPGMLDHPLELMICVGIAAAAWKLVATHRWFKSG